MKYTTFYHSTNVVFGNGSIQILGKKVKKLGICKVLIVTDPFIAQTSALDKAVSSLKKHGIDYCIFDKVKSDPDDDACLKGLDIARKEKVEGIIAIGGGSSMDQGKAIAALYTNGGTCQDWHQKKLNGPMLPTICIPTTAGTGSEVTYVAVITNTKKQFKMSIGDSENLVPVLAIDDPELTLSLPPLLTAATGMDALTHAIEAYTCKASQPVTDALALYVIETIGINIENAVKNGEDLQAREAMLSAATIAGMAFINANVGSVHALSETIGALYHTPHGIANAIFLPHVMKFNISGNEKKFAEIAKRLGIDSENRQPDETAVKGVEKILQMSERMKMPKLKDLNYIHQEDFSKIAALSANNDLSQDNARPITAEDYLNIINQAFNY